MPRDNQFEVQSALNEVHLESNVMVAMRDGVRLACDIYRPAKSGAPIE